MSSIKSRLRENMISLIVLQGANYVLPLVIVPYLVRTLGPINYGRVAFAQAFIQYFLVLTEYGFNLSATRTVVLVRDDRERLSRLVSAVIAVKVTLMVAGFLSVLLLIAMLPRFGHDYTLYSVVYLGVLGNVLFPIWLFQGLERMRQITFLTIGARLVVMALIFLFVRNSDDFKIAAGLQASGFVIAGLLSLLLLPRLAKLTFFWPRLSDMREVASDGWHVFVATIGGSVYNSSNVFFLGLFAVPVMVGYYAAAEKFIRAIQTAISPVSQAVYPHVAGLLARSRVEALDFLNRLLRIQGAATLSISCVLLAFAHPIASVLFGEGFVRSGDIIRFMALIPFVVGLNNVLGAQVLVQFNIGRLLSVSILAPALLHLPLLYLAIKFFGTTGVALLAVATEVLVLLIRIGGLASRHRDIFSSVFGVSLNRASDPGAHL